MSNEIPGIPPSIDSFDAEARRRALETAAGFRPFNLHCHSIFSYNAYGYSPSHLALLAARSGWSGVGLVDFDVLDGVEEFLAAAKLVGVPACAGMETRVFVPELAEREINSPGEPGIAYHLGVGFRSGSVPSAERTFAERLRTQAAARTRRVTELVNTVLPEIALDFDEVARRYTPAGNVTERHLCTAYREAAAGRFGDSGELAAFWREKIGAWEEAPVKLEAKIRSKLMKRGGVGYIAPTPESFPPIAEFNRFVAGCGAVPVMAWLNGLSAGESDPGALLDLHLKYGVKAVTLIPDRNWRSDDPAKSAALVAELGRFVAACRERRLPLLAGTEMNAPGQLLADDFTVSALAPFYRDFAAGVEAMTSR